MNIKKSILEVLEQVGIYIDNENQALDFDSLQYITLIVELEERFQISIEDEYLYQAEVISLNSINNMVDYHLKLKGCVDEIV